MFDSTADDLHAAIAADVRISDFVRLEWRAEVDSTNDIALALAAHEAPDGTAVVAGRQHAGRGRRGRDWFSPAGAGLYLSIVLRSAPGMLPLVTLGAGVAVARGGIRATALPIELKWPNDLVIGRPWRKLGGILCETSGTGSRVEAIVVGVGVNLMPAAYPPDLADRVTSLETELGRAPDPVHFVVELLAELRELSGRLRAGDRSWVLDHWRALAARGLGQAAVHWQDQGITRHGWARDVDEDGALVVERDGLRERIVAGEVTWERWS
jgi:BirA family biotin operon repressor/biotin-[acetyl-CoA-carboxylase] ligase